VRVQGGIGSRISFQNGVPLIGALGAIGDYTRRIVEFFTPEFDRPIAAKLAGLPRPTNIESAVRSIDLAKIWAKGTAHLVDRASPSKG